MTTEKDVVFPGYRYTDAQRIAAILMRCRALGREWEAAAAHEIICAQLNREEGR